MPGRMRWLLLASWSLPVFLQSGCGDDAAGTAGGIGGTGTGASTGQGAGPGAGGGTAGAGGGGPTTCEGVTCSGHGTCVVESGDVQCVCDDGYEAAGLACNLAPVPTCTPNRFVTPVAAGGGDGTAESPWTLEEAMAQAVAGDQVQVAAGIYMGAATGDRYLPTFAPANSGTAEAPIVFCAEFAAVYHEESPELWTVLQNDGPAAGDAACSPAYGVANASYIVWDGFAVDQADAPWRPDTSPITLVEASYVQIVRNRVVARERPLYDNNNGIRMDYSHHVTISDNRIFCVNEDTDQSNDPGGIQSYDSAYYEWAHNEIFDCATGFHPKGFHDWAEYYLLPGSIHHNLVVRATDAAFYVQAVPGVAEGSVQADDYLDIYQNVVVDSEHAITLNPPGDGMCRRLRFVNNTFAALDPVHGAGLQLVSVPGSESFHLSMVRNNIFRGMAGAYGFQGGDEAALLGGLDRIEYDYNAFFEVEAAVVVTDHVVFASVLETLGEWQTRGHDAHSNELDPLFVDYAARDLRLTEASPDRGAGIDVLDLRGQGTDAPIHLGAYITDDQSDVIGVR